MSFPRYESYRDSGIEWVGPVPAHWTIQPLFAVATECNRPNCGMIENNLLSLSYGRVVRKDINENDGLLPASFETYQIVEPNDVVWRLTDLQNDKRSLRTALVKERGIITSAYLATTPTGVTPDYLDYLLRAYDLQKVFYSMGGGLRQGMKFFDVKRLQILLPPEVEQVAIADFLDCETAKIDALVSAQRRLIELLKEERQAVVSEAVTKGLNLSVPMKDTGVPWLGEVPRHWAIKPIKYLVSFQSGGTPRKERADYWDGQIPWASAKDLKRDFLVDTDDHITEYALAERAAQLVPVGSVLVLVRGMMLARTFPVCVVGTPMAINQDLKALIPKQAIRGSFLSWALRGTQQETLGRLDESAHGTKALRMEAWSSMMLPLPPVDEQEEIARFIDRETQRCDALVKDSEAVIDLLLERRAALISAAATGRIDVRPWSAAEVQKSVAAEIIFFHARKPTFGRVKNQKLIYLAEVHAGISEIGGHYLREAAGPLDRNLIADLERELQTSGIITVSQPEGPGTTVMYVVAPGQQRDRGRLEAMLGDRVSRLDHLNDKLSDFDTRAAEAVATLYAVWNDFLLDGVAPTDDQIMDGFLGDWHPEKARKFKRAELGIWLDWMRRNGLEPQGRGPKTISGRLFP